MLKPSVADTQVMTPAKIIRLGMIIVGSHILFRIGNAMRSDDVGATCSPFAEKARAELHRSGILWPNSLQMPRVQAVPPPFSAPARRTFFEVA